MRDRRLGYRIPLDLMVTVYVNERPLRGLVLDLSDTGIRLDVVTGRAPPRGTTVQLEIGLPRVEESLWIGGTVQYQRAADLAAGLGVRFVAMTKRDARALRDFCVESRHRQLGKLLARITRPGGDHRLGSLAAPA
jgi:c-di-GMP-binding flagellar brake protein YcgR